MESDSAYLAAILLFLALNALGWRLRIVPVRHPALLAVGVLGAVGIVAALVYVVAPDDDRRDVLRMLLQIGVPLVLGLMVAMSPLARQNPWRLFVLILVALLLGMVLGVYAGVALTG